MNETWTHPTLTREQFEARTAELISEESQAPEAWWWLSICDPSKPTGQQFVGVAIVRGSGLLTATTNARRRGCNPGGEVVGYEIPSDYVVDSADTYRLLNNDEALAITHRWDG